MLPAKGDLPAGIGERVVDVLLLPGGGFLEPGCGVRFPAAANGDRLAAALALGAGEDVPNLRPAPASIGEGLAAVEGVFAFGSLVEPFTFDWASILQKTQLCGANPVDSVLLLQLCTKQPATRRARSCHSVSIR